MAKPRKRRRKKNYRMTISPWFLPVTLTAGLAIAGGILAYQSWRKKKALQGGST